MYLCLTMTASREALLKLIEEAAASAARQNGATAKRSTTFASPSSPPLSPAAMRTVTMLRPRPGLLLDGSQSVASAARKMLDSNMDAALIVSVTGEVTGILTDTDVTRRVLAKRLDPNATRVADVMTSSPACVSANGTAFDALSLMVGGLRHRKCIPVAL